MDFNCPPLSSRSLSGHQSHWECPEDPSRGKHLGPILLFLATGQAAPVSPTHAFIELPASESRWEQGGGWEWPGTL